MSVHRSIFPSPPWVLIAHLLILLPHPVQALTESDWNFSSAEGLRQAYEPAKERTFSGYLNISQGKRNPGWPTVAPYWILAAYATGIDLSAGAPALTGSWLLVLAGTFALLWLVLRR